jgi:hypothetical protein
VSLAEVKVIYESNVSDIVAMLRKRASAIEAGEYGECDAAVLTLIHGNADGIQTVKVFGLGKTDIWHSIGVLQGGIATLTRMIPEQ